MNPPDGVVRIESPVDTFERSLRAAGRLRRTGAIVLSGAALAICAGVALSSMRFGGASAHLRRPLDAPPLRREDVRAPRPAQPALGASAAPAEYPLLGEATPATPAAARVLSVLDGVRASLRATAYRHDLRVDPRRGLYEWDCSLMVSWVLQRAAPRARAALSGGARPLAVDYYRTIRAAPAGGDVAVASGTSRGRARALPPWTHVARVADARPGDVLAWQRPPWFPSHNTGHVAIVLEPPRRYTPDTVLVRIADASSFNHEDDTRAGGTGYGEGTLLVAIDERTGGGAGYGWYGRPAIGAVVGTEVVIGRPVR